jgi:hypothetical protein
MLLRGPRTLAGAERVKRGVLVRRVLDLLRRLGHLRLLLLIHHLPHLSHGNMAAARVTSLDTHD